MQCNAIMINCVFIKKQFNCNVMQLQSDILFCLVCFVRGQLICFIFIFSGIIIFYCIVWYCIVLFYIILFQKKMNTNTNTEIPKSSLRSYIQSSNILECPICLQDYNLITRQPMIACINFQTVHSICSDCASQKAFAKDSITKQFTCSICRKPIQQKAIKKYESLIEWIRLTQVLQIKFQKDKQIYEEIIENTKDQKEQLKQQIQKLKVENSRLLILSQKLRDQILKVVKTKESIEIQMKKKFQLQQRQKDSKCLKLQRQVKQLKDRLQKTSTNSHDFMERLKFAKNNQQPISKQQMKNNCFANIYEQQHNSTSLLLGRQNINDQKLMQFMQFDWPKLQTLYLDGNQLTQFGSLSNIKNLKLLRVDENNLGKKSVQKVLAVKFMALTHLLISFSNTQSNQCWQILANSKFHSFPSLKMLRICKNQLIITGGSKFILDKVKDKIKEWGQVERNRKVSIIWFE